MNKLPIVALTGVAVLLAGCGESEADKKAAADFAVTKLNQEKVIMSQLKTYWQNQDPNITDVYLVLDNDSNQRIEIASLSPNGDGTIDTKQISADDTQKILEAASNIEPGQTSSPTTQASSGMDPFMGSMMGGILGMAIGNALFSGNRSVDAHNERRRTITSSYAGSANSAYRSNYRSAMKSGSRPSATIPKGSIGRSTGGSFSSGARAGG